MTIGEQIEFLKKGTVDLTRENAKTGCLHLSNVNILRNLKKERV